MIAETHAATARRRYSLKHRENAQPKLQPRPRLKPL